ncbi:MAG: hypothetical protein R6X20_15600 [Phycisphaerae bacterium]
MPERLLVDKDRLTDAYAAYELVRERIAQEVLQALAERFKSNINAAIMMLNLPRLCTHAAFVVGVDVTVDNVIKASMEVCLEWLAGMSPEARSAIAEKLKRNPEIKTATEKRLADYPGLEASLCAALAQVPEIKAAFENGITGRAELNAAFEKGLAGPPELRAAIVNALARVPVFKSAASKIVDAVSGNDKYHRAILDALEGHKGSHDPLRALLMAGVVAGWRAYETLAKDTWIQILNQKPNQFAPRVAKVSSDDNATDKGKRLPVGEMARYGYNLEHHMGDLLVDRFHFGSVESICHSYAALSDGWPNLPDAVTADDLKVCEAVRHVCVHRAGMVDEEFWKPSLNQAAFPDARVGQPLPLTAYHVVRFVTSAIQAGTALLKYLDDRLTEAQSDTARSEDGEGGQ